MARLKKTKGVELLRVQSPSGQTRYAYFSYGTRLVNRQGTETWRGWKIDGRWIMGKFKQIKQDYIAAGWTILREFGK